MESVDESLEVPAPAGGPPPCGEHVDQMCQWPSKMSGFSLKMSVFGLPCRERSDRSGPDRKPVWSHHGSPGGERFPMSSSGGGMDRPPHGGACDSCPGYCDVGGAGPRARRTFVTEDTSPFLKAREVRTARRASVTPVDEPESPRSGSPASSRSRQGRMGQGLEATVQPTGGRRESTRS